MPIIRLETRIIASPERCFDLARDVGLHQRSTASTRERAVAGVTSGRLGPGDWVTWEAIHFGLRLRLTSRITQFDPPHRFIDVMVRGPFERLEHVHEFSRSGDATEMRDLFDYASPLGILGRIADALVVRHYLERFLQKRNAYLKEVA
ncbi:MAG: SRPBCC family protein, partial [Chloroflexi bacterium]